MPTFTIFTALISVLSISYAVYYWRKSQNKKKQLKLRVIKGRLNILGIKISQIEKSIISVPSFWETAWILSGEPTLPKN